MERQKSENAEAEERNKQLIAEVADLKAGMAAIEERARSELGMIGRNETFYQVVPVRPRTALPTRPAEHTQDRRALISLKLRAACAISSSSRPRAAAGDSPRPCPSNTPRSVVRRSSNTR